MHQGFGSLTRIAGFSYLMSMLDQHPPMVFLTSGSKPGQSAVHGKAFIVLLCKPSKLHRQECWFRPQIMPFYIYVGNKVQLYIFYYFWFNFCFTMFEQLRVNMDSFFFVKSCIVCKEISKLPSSIGKITFVSQSGLRLSWRQCVYSPRLPYYN